MKISVLRLCAICFAKNQWGYKGLFKMAVCPKKSRKKPRHRRLGWWLSSTLFVAIIYCNMREKRDSGYAEPRELFS